MSNLKITAVKTILTAPGGIDLAVVKVETNQPGLYGLGCATFTQRIHAVKTAIDEYMAPFLIGKDPARIEDIWQSACVSGYWRSGPNHEQRTIRCGYGIVGYQGQIGRHASVRVAGRAMP